MDTKWNREYIVGILQNPTVGNNPKIIFKMLDSMMNRQTLDERSDGETKHRNGVGFNGPDANFMTYWHKKAVEFHGNIAPWRLPEIAERLVKYAGQLEAIAAANIVANRTSNPVAEAEYAEQQHQKAVKKRAMRKKRSSGLSREEKQERADTFFNNEYNRFMQHARSMFGDDFGRTTALA